MYKAYTCLILRGKIHHAPNVETIVSQVYVSMSQLNLLVSYHSLQGGKRRILMSGFLTKLNLSICIHNNLKLLR